MYPVRSFFLYIYRRKNKRTGTSEHRSVRVSESVAVFFFYIAVDDVIDFLHEDFGGLLLVVG